MDATLPYLLSVTESAIESISISMGYVSLSIENPSLPASLDHYFRRVAD